MRTNTSTITLIIGGAVLAVAGFITTVVYLFQPWRSCPYEDTAAGCAMLPLDATVMTIALFATVLGVVVVVTALFLRRVAQMSIPFHDRTPLFRSGR